MGRLHAPSEPEKVEGLRFALSAAASLVPSEAPELDQPRLVGVRLHPGLAEPFGHRALRSGFDDPLVKPMDSAQLRDLLAGRE